VITPPGTSGALGPSARRALFTCALPASGRKRSGEVHQDGQTVRPVHEPSVYGVASSVPAALSRTSSETSNVRVSSSL
jgi:hypothetical protein